MPDEKTTTVEPTVEELKAEVVRLKALEEQYKGLQTKTNKLVDRNRELTKSTTSTNLSITSALKRHENLLLALARFSGKQNNDDDLGKLADTMLKQAQVDEYRASFTGELDSVLEEYDANFNTDPDLADAREALAKGKAEEALAITKIRLAERGKKATKSVEELVQEQVDARMKQFMKVDTSGSTAGQTKRATGDELVTKAASGSALSDDETEELMRALGIKGIAYRRKK